MSDSIFKRKVEGFLLSWSIASAALFVIFVFIIGIVVLFKKAVFVEFVSYVVELAFVTAIIIILVDAWKNWNLRK